MGEPVEQRCCHLGVPKNRSPFREAQVGGDDDASALIELTQEMEEQSATRRAERQVSQFVKDDQIGMDEPVGDLSRLALGFFLFQRIDEFNGGEEADTLAVMFDRLDAERCCKVRLPGSRSPEENGIVSLLDELVAVKLAHERLIDLAAGKVEAALIPLGRKACCLELIGHGSDLPFRGLGLEQLGQDRDGSLEGGRALFGEITDGLGHAMHLEALEHDDDGGAGWIMTHCGSPSIYARRHSVRHWPSVPG